MGIISSVTVPVYELTFLNYEVARSNLELEEVLGFGWRKYVLSNIYPPTPFVMDTFSSLLSRVSFSFLFLYRVPSEVTHPQTSA